MGQQDVHIGRPLAPDELRPLNYRDRRHRVIDAINHLGPANEVEEPLAPDPAFAAAVRAWCENTGTNLGHAALFCILEQLPEPSPEIAALVAGARVARAEYPRGSLAGRACPPPLRAARAGSG
jgi:hypothetical protein